MDGKIEFPIKRSILYKGNPANTFSVLINNLGELSFWNRYEAGEWESQTLDFLIQNSGEGLFLDIGSWIGPMSLLLSTKFEKIISVDFDPVASEHFRKNIELNGFTNIKQINIGLSDKRDKVKLNKQFFGSSETSLFYINSSEEGYEVEVITLGDLIERTINPVELKIIKVDIEGGEFKIINDVYKILNENKIMVMLSYHPFHLGIRKWRIFRLIHSLKQLKYTRYIFKTTGIIKIDPYDFKSLITHKFPLADVLQS